MFRGVWLYIQIILGNGGRLNISGINGDIRLRPGSFDLLIFHQVFLEHQYSFHFLDKPAVIIDAGGHIGFFSLFMKSQFPDARIVSIEPDEDNFHLLRSNLAAYPDVVCLQRALWNKETTLGISDKFQLGKMAMVVEEKQSGKPVESVTINQLLKDHHIDTIDILKLDIETSERSLFDEGCGDWLPKVRMIIIELHDWMEEGCSRAFFNALNLYIPNYEYYIKGENTIVLNKDINSERSIRVPI